MIVWRSGPPEMVRSQPTDGRDTTPRCGVTAYPMTSSAYYG